MKRALRWIALLLAALLIPALAEEAPRVPNPRDYFDPDGSCAYTDYQWNGDTWEVCFFDQGEDWVEQLTGWLADCEGAGLTWRLEFLDGDVLAYAVTGGGEKALLFPDYYGTLMLMKPYALAMDGALIPVPTAAPTPTPTPNPVTHSDAIPIARPGPVTHSDAIPTARPGPVTHSDAIPTADPGSYHLDPEDISGGHNETYYEETPCWNCHGTGVCQECHGTGTYYHFGQSIPCSKVCPSCHGSKVDRELKTRWVSD